MRKIDSAIIRLALTGIMAGIFCPATLSAYTINGSIVTLEASDRTSDNTSLIQGFLNNATYTKIIIPPGPGNVSWPVRPLFFNHNNTEIHLNANTVLEAKNGGYPNGGDCVFKASSLSNIQVTGDAGSKILMHKEEYAILTAAEWRTALNFMSCSNVTVSGLTLANTGGDGIYLGDATGTGYCSNVIITNVVIDGAARNGLTVISVDGLTVTGCTFKNTRGQGNAAANGPWAGIDLEPNNSSERLKNIVIDDCIFLNNGYCGFIQSTSQLNGSTGILNMTIRNCTMQGNGLYGIMIAGVPATLEGSVTFQNCTICDNNDMGIWVRSKARDAGTLSFINCTLSNNNLVGSNTAFLISNYGGTTEVSGNIQLNNLVVVQPTSRAVGYFLRVDGTNCLIDNVSGNIYASGGLLYKYNTTNLDVTTASNAVPSDPGTTSFLHNWKMDETCDSTVGDSGGNCNGTLLNIPSWTIGQIGGGLTLNGINQLVTIANDASLNIGTGDFSISLWMQRSSSTVTNSRLLYKGASADSDIGYALSGSNISLGFVLCNGITRITTYCPIPSLNQWYHIVFNVDRVNGKVTSYLNGICQASTDIGSFNSGDISNTRNLLIGAAGNNGYLAWPGKVDDVRIYGRVLTPGEIAYLAAGASACWQLDDGYGSGATDYIGRSPGMLQNNPTWTTGKFGGALAMNGINQFMSISSNSSDLNIGTGDFSISLWMQRSDSAMTNSRLLYKGASADTDIGYALSGSNTSLSMGISNGVDRVLTWCTIPSLNQWHHFVFTVNRGSGKAKSYVDGIYQSSTDISAFSGGDISNTTALLIGAANNTGWLAWPGEVDDIRIYKRVLSADEVARLYFATP